MKNYTFSQSKITINSHQLTIRIFTIYHREITAQLDQAETFVRDQVILQADCIRKLIVAEASLFKNI